MILVPTDNSLHVANSKHSDRTIKYREALHQHGLHIYLYLHDRAVPHELSAHAYEHLLHGGPRGLHVRAADAAVGT